MALRLLSLRLFSLRTARRERGSFLYGEFVDEPRRGSAFPRNRTRHGHAMAVLESALDGVRFPDAEVEIAAS